MVFKKRNTSIPYLKNLVSTPKKLFQQLPEAIETQESVFPSKPAGWSL